MGRPSYKPEITTAVSSSLPGGQGRLPRAPWGLFQYPGPTASFHVLARGHFPAEPLSVGLTALEPEPRERVAV